MCDHSNLQEIQKTAGKYLIRHRSVLDATSKMQEYSARVNRAIAKAVTGCGCIKIKASKQHLPSETSYTDIGTFMQDHIEGKLCAGCRDTLAHEIGTTIFYLAALSNILGLDLDEAVGSECERINALGIYSLK